MTKIACIILTIGEGFKLIASLLNLVASILGKYAPILKMTLTDNEISGIDSKILATIKSLAVLHNSEATTLSIITITIVWISLLNNQKWAFWLILFIGLFSSLIWFYTDHIIGNKTLIVNLVFTTIFLVGIILSGISIYR
jgi:hypothetical protein